MRLGKGFGGGYRGGRGWRGKKLDLPIFNGTNPDRWIIRAERFFRFYWLADEEKVEAVVVSLDGGHTPVVSMGAPPTSHSPLGGNQGVIVEWVPTNSHQNLAWSVVGSPSNRQRGGLPKKIHRADCTARGGDGGSGIGEVYQKEGVKNELWVNGPRTLELAMDQTLRIDNKQNALGRTISYSHNSWGQPRVTTLIPIPKPLLILQPQTHLALTNLTQLAPEKA